MTLVPAVLPALFLVIAVLGFSSLAPARVAAMRAGVAFGVLVVLNTEALSLVSQLKPLPVAVMWLAECAVGAVLLFRVRARALALFQGLRSPRWSRYAWTGAAGIAVIAAATLVTAVVAPPNTYDSMAYHMARIAHWVADGNLLPYPTNIVRQLYQPPWSEFAIAQLQILSGGDQFANLVQWLAMAGSLLGVARITQQLGAPPAAQLMAAVVVATLPMGILQASSTQTDYAEAFWLVCAVSFALDFIVSPGPLPAAWLAAALGLAALTKGTAYLFAAPLVIGVGLWMVIRLRQRMLVPAVVLLVVPLLINAGQLARNEALFGNPLSYPPDNQELANQTFAPNAIASNLIRDAAVQLGTPTSTINNLVVGRVIVALHNRVLHIDVNDPRTTWPQEPFIVNPTSLDEDYSSDPLQTVLAIIAILFAIVVGLRGGSRPVATYAAGLVLSYLLFAAYLKWQPWDSRLELPLLVLAAPVVGFVVARIRIRGAATAVTAVLCVAALPWAFDNASRPLIGYGIPKEAHYLPQGQTILNTPRTDLYFVKRTDLEAPYIEAVARARQRGCGVIGLLSTPADWEYPLWALGAGSGGTIRVDQIQVDNVSSRLSTPGGTPCLLVVVVADHPAEIDVGGTTFTLSLDESGVAIYEPA